MAHIDSMCMEHVAGDTGVEGQHTCSWFFKHIPNW
jgi:hypothetical protein